MARTEEIDIVIVGGGICGLAIALALHRKGIKSLVLERSDKIRASGTTIGVLANGWRALRELGVDATLRATAIPLKRAVDVDVNKGSVVEESPYGDEEARCILRSDLVSTLANELPPGVVRFDCQVLSVNEEKSSSRTLVELQDGTLIKAKVLIGCDGVNSIISDYIGLRPTRLLNSSVVRGITTYPNGHGFEPEFLLMKRGTQAVGRIPIDDKEVSWFVQGLQGDAELPKGFESIRKFTIGSTAGYPAEIVNMIEKCDPTTLSIVRLRYRAPWDLWRGDFRRGGATVAGDAWHVMGPFIAQGGSAALEDAVVLGRCLSKRILRAGGATHLSEQKAKEALDEYLKERRVRVTQLSTITYLIAMLSVEKPNVLWRFLYILILVVAFRDSLGHTKYDCGKL